MRIITGMPTAAEIPIAVPAIIARADEHAAAIPAIIRIAVIISVIGIAPIPVTITGPDITAGERCGEEQTKRQPGRPRMF
jgi:hypothetical protein